MSWQIFKNNILSVASSPQSIQSIEQIADLYATEYDNAIKRGTETINKIPLVKGNTDIMKQLFRVAFLAGQSSIVPYDLVGSMGPGILAYWQGGELAKAPIPIIPAVGSIINIGITSANCTNPGQWAPQTPIPPNSDPSLLIDLFILAATAHLQTISGIINTVSLYPPLATPAPGILTWSGYFVPPSSPGGVSAIEPAVQQLLQTIPIDNNTKEGAAAVVSETGKEVITDGGDDGGEQLDALKEELPDDKPPFDELDDTEAEEIVKEDPSSKNVKVNQSNGVSTDCKFGSLDYNMQLSPNYRLRDLSIGCVFAHKIKAQVGLNEEDIVCNLRNLAINILEPLKAKYPNIRINSAFRGTPSIPGGVSQHQKGEAVDIQISGYSPRDYVPLANWCISNLPFDQLIFEHGNSIWLHISCKKDAVQRKQLLTMYRGNYSSGLKLYYV
jgi:hypothetical protein